ncbi:MAG: hypothetical protein COA99_06365 [Moraxellaceae bacterium]|nr:MAG: hypothetical protein COA99_06365 [Moraxellaceae bacterium]
MIPPAVINQVAKNLQDSGAAMSTLSEVIRSEDVAFDSNAVKVVSDKNGIALYFSRAPIPWNRNGFSATGGTLPQQLCMQRHIGIYGYRVAFLHQFVQWGPCALEQVESLEQLRAMWHGVKIHVEQAIETPPPGIDTEADLQAVRQLLEV